MRLTNSPSSMIWLSSMWEPRRLTTRWTSTTCYSDSFSFLLWNYRIYLNDINLSKRQYKHNLRKILSISDAWFRRWNIEINKHIWSVAITFVLPANRNDYENRATSRSHPIFRSNFHVWKQITYLPPVNMNLIIGWNDKILVTLTHRLHYACWEYSSKRESKGRNFLN
jgi:hypothetical protein